jgi:LPS-assembly lipoprotein
LAAAAAAVLLAGLAALTACGFRPLYGQPDGRAVVGELAAIEISPLTGRLGVEIYNRLRDRLSPRGSPGDPRYLLAVSFETTRSGLVTERDSQISRFELGVNARYTLLDGRSGAPLSEGTARAVASYNVLEAETYATLVAEEDAGRKAAREVSEAIVGLIALHFERWHAGGAEAP